MGQTAGFAAGSWIVRQAASQSQHLGKPKKLEIDHGRPGNSQLECLHSATSHILS
jgi:hypothetical protein